MDIMVFYVERSDLTPNEYDSLRNLPCADTIENASEHCRALRVRARLESNGRPVGSIDETGKVSMRAHCATP